MQQHEKFEEEPESNIIQLTAGYPVWILIEGTLNKSALQKSFVISNGPTSHVFHGLTLSYRFEKLTVRSEDSTQAQSCSWIHCLWPVTEAQKKAVRKRMMEQPLAASAISSQRHQNQDVCKFSEINRTANPGINLYPPQVWQLPWKSAKLVFTKKEENPSLFIFWQTTSVTIQNWLEFIFLRHWLLSDFTTLASKTTARHIFYKILQAGWFYMHQFYMCKLPWIWSSSVCTRHIYTCMKEKVVVWKRGLPRNREKSKQV